MKWFSEDQVFFSLFSAFALVVVVVLVWLIRERASLKHELSLLSHVIGRNDRDIAGLCAAAISIDERLTAHESLINNLKIPTVEVKQVEEPEQPYRTVIQRVQGGANVTELMQTFGLSRDEATLLIRLHGPKSEFNQ